jgi:ketosteroid isomerase-like protein
MSTTANRTEQVIGQHLSAFLEGRGVDEILADYHEDAVLVAPQAVYRGKPEIRGFFVGFLANLPPGARDDFRLERRECTGDLGYIVWSVKGSVPLGTDTFIVRNGKIAQQTFAMYPKPSAD